jgi:FkbM family methyltransferase
MNDNILKIKLWAIKHLPFLVKYKSFLVALKDKLLPNQKTYAQNNEDTVLLNLIRGIKTSISIDYIDVGANHPTNLSNTYLLYLNNFKGYLIEPNPNLCNLLKKFRPKDNVLNIGNGCEASIIPFFISRTPASSSFDKNFFNARNQTLDRISYIPVLSLDQTFAKIESKTIGVLSVDVEGWNLKVIKAAKSVISRTQILCIEYDTLIERSSILELVKDFELINDNGLNLIMKRKS